MFYFVGRAGSMIKTAGANVTPAEVEKALTTVLESIDPGAVVLVLGLPDDERGQIVAAAIASDTVTALDQQEVLRALRPQLSAYKIPRRMITLRHDDVPRLSSGKVNLPALRRRFDA